MRAAATLPTLSAALPEAPDHGVLVKAAEAMVYGFEFGVSAGNRLCDAAAWGDQALATLLSDRWTAVRGFSWWNERWQNDDDPAHDSDMRVQAVPGLVEVFRSRLATPKLIDRPLSGS